VAEQIVRRHNVLKEFFTEVLAVDAGVAEDCACKMEHLVPDMVMERFVEFVRCHQDGNGKKLMWVEGQGFVSRENGP
jgi:DtxR family Mn-dependent transcriptional regulator